MPRMFDKIAVKLLQYGSQGQITSKVRVSVCLSILSEQMWVARQPVREDGDSVSLCLRCVL